MQKIAVVLLLVVLAVVLAAQATNTPHQKARLELSVRWEYQYLMPTKTEDWEKQVATLGQQGWELVGFSGIETNERMWFKRRAQ